MAAKELIELKQDMNNRFAFVDRRFEQIDQRFEQIDQRFEQIDQRFEQIDQRFALVDQRFALVDQRFDRLEARMDKSDENFHRMGLRMEAMHDDIKIILEVLTSTTKKAEKIGLLESRSKDHEIRIRALESLRAEDR